MQGTSDLFYHHLPAHKLSLPELLKNTSLFEHVPEDWHVIISDIKGSTKAIQEGKHETVNFLATGSIVTVLNFVFKTGMTVPFFFGGDGATFIVPPSVLPALMNLLLRYKENVLLNFGLQLRVGTVPVQQVYNQGHELRISKFNISSSFSIPVVLGTGLNYAERLIKAEDYLFGQLADVAAELDLTGMQCRWDKIGPPENSTEVVTLLVFADNGHEQSAVFSKVFKLLDDIYGEPRQRQPISVAKLKLKTTFNRLRLELRGRVGALNFVELVRTWLTNLYGYIYFYTTPGKNYLNRLVEMSDTLVIDGKINTVISGDDRQRLKLLSALEELEKKGEVKYGIHISNDAVMSCYVRDLEEGHVHFVDGSEGGYTKAAIMLKSKLVSA
ncbi:hypothetical protein AQ505_15865 [Pedobacter sp. PACM 27299]|uniref:DUF3095 domain-containing protein n=1 Tax=Pedobacter sp. PACM 27299 TaxID=1727164 RepID=UPI0007057F37|nr:DUF3095 domain-containing protein [Pedobacter sp. PACM 27299]ALL06834.1 hypothetical protein AQ505_15865 [Pedobacter sp. PACM 27299]